MVQEFKRVTEDIPQQQSLAVLVTGSAASIAVVHFAEGLAQALGIPWEAIYVEMPDNDRHGEAGIRAADALGFAASNGGTIATVAAATLLDGALAHLRSSPATHLVLEPNQTQAWMRFWRESTLDALVRRTEGVAIHVAGTGSLPQESTAFAGKSRMPGRPVLHYVYAVGLVAATLLLAELLQQVTGTRSLDLVFLFPVIAIAARLGLPPALLAGALSVFSYNYFLLVPAFAFDLTAPQNVVMTAVLFAAAAYTSMVTGRMRGRLLLSDRSARENASLATLAQRLTRDADWDATALTLCEHVHGLFGLQTAVFREIGTDLVVAGAVPPDVTLGPIDKAALDWSWAEGEEAGAGTANVSASDWQFQPLKTSLGTLAVLGVARHDGRDPIRPDQRVLLSTIIAQGALAHERLRLEDMLCTAPASKGSDQA